MKSGQEFDVVLKKKSWKPLPKKILRHTKIQISDRYSYNASVWIANTPESNMSPTVNLVLQHNGSKIRLCCPSVATLILAIGDLNNWIGEVSLQLHDSHKRAVEEYLAHHEETKPDTFNDYTVLTVIQDRLKKKGCKKAILTDSETGEVLDEYTGSAKETETLNE